jgi:hypothetical protein
MLSPQDQQLLTGYVDGELTARQRCQVERLLSRSGEARALLQDLQEDSRSLRLLPSMSAPADLADYILETIARKGLKPGSRPRVPAPPRVYVLPSWVGFAAAAAVLFIVGVGSFYLHSQGSNPEEGAGSGIASRPAGPDDPPRPLPPPPDKDRTPLVKDTPKLPEPLRTPGGVEEKEPNFDEEDEPGTMTPGKEPTPGPVRPSVLATPGGSEPPRPLERVELVLPVVLKLHELDRADQART